ncbi:uncharacterized protein LOC103317449 [Nasonia vitripennis]|uniref:Uncharacterized protein n=1 Tax=Nasonia vitripennis TaxID=7425 RepID=A0A7M7QAI8_NASVI|nr:uncharacterized protein LOC103317449 [Nasonia vitripennis]
MTFPTTSIISLRILGLFPFQMHSHYVMCRKLMRELAVKGHRVDVYSYFPLNQKILNYHDYSLAGTLPAISNNMSFKEIPLVWGSDSIKEWLKAMGIPICRLLGLPIFQNLLHDPPIDAPYDLVIIELSAAQCYIPFGRRLNVPVIGVVTTPYLLDWQYDSFGTPINLAIDPSCASQYEARMNFLERLDNFVLYNRAYWTFVLSTREHDKVVERIFGLGLPEYITGFSKFKF